MFFGRVSEYKGVESLLEVVSSLSSELYSELLIVGRSQYKVDYSLFKHDKSKLVIVDEFVSESAIKEYFDQSSILVLPYIEVTQSGVLMLGISSLTPMVISDCGGLKEQLDDGEAIFYQNNNRTELSDALTLLLTEHQAYSSYQKNQKDLIGYCLQMSLPKQLTKYNPSLAEASYFRCYSFFHMVLSCGVISMVLILL